MFTLNYRIIPVDSYFEKQSSIPDLEKLQAVQELDWQST